MNDSQSTAIVMAMAIRKFNQYVFIHCNCHYNVDKFSCMCNFCSVSTWCEAAVNPLARGDWKYYQRKKKKTSQENFSTKDCKAIFKRISVVCRQTVKLHHILAGKKEGQSVRQAWIRLRMASCGKQPVGHWQPPLQQTQKSGRRKDCCFVS